MPERRERLVYELAMAVVAVLSVLLLVATEAGGAFGLGLPVLWAIDGVLVVVSVVDWCIGLARAPSRRDYLAVTAAELPGLVPLFLGHAGPLRVLRLLRLVRVGRALALAHHTMRRRDVSPWIVHVHTLAWGGAGLVFLGALLVWIVERGENDGFATFADALWWAVVTVTTVGYGDITPVTGAGRALAVLLMVSGIGLFAVLISLVGTGLVWRPGQPGGLAPGSDDAEAGAGAVVAAAGEGDVSASLQRLARLHDTGALDDDEFRQAKRRVLQRDGP